MEQVPVTTVGQRLKSAREERGLTIEDVAAEIMVPQHYLSSIELDRFDTLPGQTYAIGFVRNYSRYLELPSDDIINQLKAQAEFPKPMESFEIASGFVPDQRPSLMPSLGSVAAGLCVVAAVYGLWTVAADGESTAALPSALPGIEVAEAVDTAPTEPAPLPAVEDITPQQERVVEAVAEERPTDDVPALTEEQVASIEPEANAVPAEPELPAPDVSEPNQIAIAEPVARPAQPLENTQGAEPVQVATAETAPVEDVSIHVAEESWIEVRAGGRIFYSGIKKAGDVLRVPADTAQRAVLTTGNAGGIWFSVGDWASSTLGDSGRVRRNLDLSPTNLVAELAPAERS